MKRATLLGTLALAACATTVGDDLGEMMLEDGGQWLVDAGQMLTDAGSAIVDAGHTLDDGALAQPNDDAATDPDTSEPGQRLRPRYTTTTYSGADGSVRTTRAFAGWWDTTRNEPCTLQEALDNQKRCLPTVEVLNIGYADSACSQTVAWRDTDAPRPATAAGYGYVVQEDKSVRFARLGAALSSKVIYLKQRGACAMESALSVHKVFPIATDVLSSDFVAFTVTTTTE